MTALRRMQLEEQINDLMLAVENLTEKKESIENKIDDLNWEIYELQGELGE